MVIASIAVFAGFVAVMNGIRPHDSSIIFCAYFTDTAGLNKGADVRFGGAKVGRVSSIALDPADHSQLRVEAKIEAGVPVNAKSEAYITQTSLTAEMHLEISTGDKSAALLKPGESITPKQGGLFNQAGDILDGVKDLMGIKEAKAKAAQGEGKVVTVASLLESVDSTVKKGSDLVTDIQSTIGENREKLSSILTKVQEVENSANGLVTDLNGVLAENRGNIQGALEGVHRVVDDVNPVIQRVVHASERLDELAATLQSTLDNAKSLTSGANGLVNDNRPVIEDLVLDLRETVRHLKTFSRTMAEQPQAVITGKPVQGRK
ncbi:MAG: MlaD family protein [Candidatus Hydrogenedentes bacterium]|nr:MlaD family protein [Candidatus Hydrogenedentota bacterium]